MFKFEINKEKWVIKTVSAAWIKEEYNKKTESNSQYVFGLTSFPDRTIYLNDEQSYDQLRRTVMHELMHAYLWTVGACGFSQFDEEDVCNFSSASHYLIHEIMEEYFKPVIMENLNNNIIKAEDGFPCEMLK
jgi:hypothetical protein